MLNHSIMVSRFRVFLHGGWASASTPVISSRVISGPHSPSCFPNFEDPSFISPISCSDSIQSIQFLSFCTKLAQGHGGRCWNCHGSTTPFLVCDRCRSVQPVDHSLDFFHIFGIEKKFEFENYGDLEAKYKEWQKKLHPDLVHTKSEQERAYAADQSARVIEAYRTLKNPLSRAIYMLRLEGVHMDEERTITDPDLLSEVLELREAVEEASDSEALDNIRLQAQKSFQYWTTVFSNAMNGSDFVAARTSIQRMSYYNRIDEQIVDKQ